MILAALFSKILSSWRLNHNQKAWGGGIPTLKRFARVNVRNVREANLFSGSIHLSCIHKLPPADARGINCCGRCLLSPKAMQAWRLGRDACICQRNWRSKHKKNRLSADFLWWALRGSNSRPSRCKRDALPAELSAHRVYGKTYTRIKINNQAKNCIICIIFDVILVCFLMKYLKKSPQYLYEFKCNIPGFW